ncbi:alpha/beta fold hydrolase [Nonomuraea rubra]|uniref:alpha/beta fold hydrolase n=1 Tax=Nonomuraea rubra TaxID=46180 RepID=UPI0036102C3C
MIHGGPDWDHSYLLDPLIRLADRHDLIFPDLRGCGRSTRGLPDDQYTPAAATGDLVALLDALGVATTDVLGFSYGGLIAQRLALAAPDRVRRLVIASSSVLPVPRTPSRAGRNATAAPPPRRPYGPTRHRPAATRPPPIRPPPIRLAPIRPAPS